MRRTKEVQTKLWHATCRQRTFRMSSTSTTTPPSTPATPTTPDDEVMRRSKKREPPPPEKVDYTTDYQTLRAFTDVNIMKNDGRIIPFTANLISVSAALDFPTVYGSNLKGVDCVIPAQVEGDAKLVCFSIKEYGFQLVRSWCDPFASRYNPIEDVENKENKEHSTENTLEEHSFKEHSKEHSSALPPPSTAIKSRVKCTEVIFVEYSFLWFARKVFADASKPKILPQQWGSTVLSFGSIQKFANALELPNKFTGYVYLLDKNNKIRWKGAGQSDPDQLEVLYRLTEELLEETDRLKIEAIEQKKLDRIEATRKELIKEAQETCTKK